MPSHPLARECAPLSYWTNQARLEIVVGRMLSDSLFTAQGKVGSRLKLILAGTLGPMATSAGHWWFDLVKGWHRGQRTHVQYFKGELESWDKWPTIRKANPLIGLDAHTRKVILEERDSARCDPRLKARFLSYPPEQTFSATTVKCSSLSRTGSRSIEP